MKRYLIIVERTDTGYSAYSPDLPGCVATGSSREKVEGEMRAAVELHLEALRAQGDSAPEPNSYATYIDVAA